MSLFSSPEEHAANPPASWRVKKLAKARWAVLVADSDTPLDTFSTKKLAEASRVIGYLVELYELETRWYAGEQIPGWRPYASVAAERRPGVETVRPHHRQDAGREGWAYGVVLERHNRRARGVQRWLVVPGSDFGVKLFSERAGAKRELARRFGSNPDPFIVHRVRSVYRYGRNWFELLDQEG